MKVAIGSGNPVKIAAVKLAFRKVFPKGNFAFIPIEVPSGVPAQPFGSQTIRGAANRAERARKKADADYGVGIEGGIRKVGRKRHFLEAWSVIVDRDGRKTLGAATMSQISGGVLGKIIKEGKELGKATDEVFGTKDVGRKEGFVGVMTNGVVTRKDALAYAVTMALATREKLLAVGEI
jgi:inosine/xanthosine triphosphatase